MPTSKDWVRVPLRGLFMSTPAGNNKTIAPYERRAPAIVVRLLSVGLVNGNCSTCCSWEFHLSTSWSEIDLTAVPTDQDVLPEGVEFTFELLKGARYGKFDPNRIEAAAKVVDGEFAGRVSYFSYPDPEKHEWSKGVFVRMTRATGVEIEAGEDPVEYLHRVAGSKFLSKVKHRAFSTDGVDGVKAELAIGNVKPVK